MERFLDWWKQDKRDITLVKSLLLGLLPLACCLVYCAVQGRGIGEVYLPGSEWNDELFYYKQVESIVDYGYPLGYYGFNESHALKLSFAAWSPVLVFPWIVWGLLFGWNLMSPIICNIFLMSLVCFLFVWLVKPSWKQLGILVLLFCLYTPFVRYMLSVMPEVICFSMLILFYSLAVNYLRRERTYKLALLFVLSGVMTLMRPYFLLFLLLPMWFWIRKSAWKGAAGSFAVLGAVLGLYACIKHYFGAEYFAPLFFTDWVSAFFEQGLFGGIRYSLGKLYYMGRDFASHTAQGFRTGLASGAFFAGFLVCMCVLTGQSIRDWRVLRRLRKADAARQAEPGTRMDAAKQTEPGTGTEAARQTEAGNAAALQAEPGTGTDAARQAEPGTETDTDSKIRRLADWLLIEAHLAFSFIAMLFALLLMYKLTEGSKHLLTFMAAAVFVIALMETKFFKKAVFVGVTFVYFYTVMAVDPYDYQVPFLEEARQVQVERWEEVFAEKLTLTKENVPNYDNAVIWVFSDKVDGTGINTKWQLLYGLPKGFGISCCMNDYVIANFDTLQSRYIATVNGGVIDEMCAEAGYTEIGRDDDMAVYQRY